MKRMLVRDRVWRVQSEADVAEGKKLLTLLDPNGGDTLQVLSPPEEYEVLPEEAPKFASQGLSPWKPWFEAHQAIRLSSLGNGDAFAALHAGRISPEPYQFAPLAKMLNLPKPRLLIADDVGLGKTVEAGISLLELIARGRGERILLIVPPGLIPQWQDEMLEKFGLKFDAIENAAALERAQTNLSEGIKPWVFLNRIITSVEYIKKKEVIRNALDPRWDVIVVDEAHYLSESGTPRNPYLTARARLGQQLREACNSLILLTATPHNGYSHGFRSLLEMVEPTDATFEGDKEVIRRRVSRNMLRRLKQQIFKTDEYGKKVPAFVPRAPVKSIPVADLSEDETRIFKLVSSYCSKTARAASGSDDKEIVSFAMQIIKKRMLSSRAALAKTVHNRLEALKSRDGAEEPPSRAEVRELQGDLPIGESAQERIAERIVRSAIPKDERRRNAEKRQLADILKLLKRLGARPDPKITTLISDLKRDVLPGVGEKAIIFTEYRDTLRAIREAFESSDDFRGKYVELTGGLTPKQRQTRMAQFEKPEIHFMLATDAASEGLNLQFKCRRLYHFELPWNPNRMEQRNGRIDRYGQRRTPVIRYFYYPNSPEDDLLNRLIKRILEMQQDQVSTPDILGILSSARIEEVLTDIDPDENVEEKETTLFKIIEEGRAQFDREVAPLLAVGDVDSAVSDIVHSLSADPLIDDNLQFESLLLRRLGSAVAPADIAHTYKLKTPRALIGPGVQEGYHCFTARRSIAVQYPARDVEFVTRLHPLYQAILNEAYLKLTASHSDAASTRRLAVRSHSKAKIPHALFTFSTDMSGEIPRLICMAVDDNGNTLDDSTAQAAMDETEPVGEVSWKTVADHFEKTFDKLQAAAHESTRKKLQSMVDELKRKRRNAAKVLRADAECYRKDRLAEIDREEKEAKLVLDADSQQLLFKGHEVSGFKAKRAFIETFHQRRLKEIEQYENAIAVPSLQPLGVLFVFPAEAKDVA